MSPTNEDILVAARSIPIPDDRATDDEWAAYEIAVARAALALQAKLAEPVNRGHVGHLWRSDETGRLRLVELDCVITHRPGWSPVGPLFLGRPETVKREPLADQQIDALMESVLGQHYWSNSAHQQDLLRACARAVERAQGIGQEGGAS